MNQPSFLATCLLQLHEASIFFFFFLSLIKFQMINQIEISVCGTFEVCLYNPNEPRESDLFISLLLGGGLVSSGPAGGVLWWPLGWGPRPKSGPAAGGPHLPRALSLPSRFLLVQESTLTFATNHCFY